MNRRLAKGIEMTALQGVRWGWLKFMYIVTIVIAGGYGLGMIFVPNQMKSIFRASCDPIPYGILGSLFLAFGLLAILGLRAPLKFVPVLLFQLTYKAVWLVGVVLPLLITGRFPASHTPTVLLFMLIVVGDLIAIPFRQVFAKQTEV
jgi:hypothetical protein